MTEFSAPTGKLANTVSASAADLTSGTNLMLGRSQQGDYYDGLLDDVMLFNYALTPHQISVLYNQNSAVRFGPASGSQ